MKRAIPFFILLAIIFSACSNSQALPTSTMAPFATKTLVENAENWSLKPFVKNLLLSSGGIISSDGQWIVANYYTHPALASNKIFSVNDPEQTIDFTYSLPTPTPQSYTFDSWSPDSTGFVGIHFGETTSGLDYCCGQSVAISNISNERSQSYTFTWGWFEKPDIFWSWDSSKIGLAFRHKGFWIIDRHGNLIKKIPLNDISNLVWSKDSIYAITYIRNHQNDGYDYNLYKVDLNDDSAEQIYTFNDYADPIGFDESSNRLLIYVSYPPIKLLLFDLGTNEVVKEIDLPSGTNYLETSSSLQYTAISTDDSRLWVFDLTKQSLKYYGKIANFKGVFGWFSNLNGFLIRTDNGDLKIINP